MLEIKQIVNSIFSSCTYLIRGDELNYWLVDIGDIEPIMSLIPNGASIRGVFITHTHFDHIYGINELTKYYPDCMVYVSSSGEKGLYSDQLNLSRYHDKPFLYEGKNVQVLKDGDKVELLPGILIDVIETPGHDQSCMTFILENAIFSGDSYIPGKATFTRFANSDKEEALISERRITSLSKDKIVYPGHFVK